MTARGVGPWKTPSLGDRGARRLGGPGRRVSTVGSLAGAEEQARIQHPAGTPTAHQGRAGPQRSTPHCGWVAVGSPVPRYSSTQLGSSRRFGLGQEGDGGQRMPAHVIAAQAARHATRQDSRRGTSRRQGAHTRVIEHDAGRDSYVTKSQQYHRASRRRTLATAAHGR